MKNRMFFIDENETIEDVLEQIDNFFNKDDRVDKFEKISFFKKDTFNVLKSYINYLKKNQRFYKKIGDKETYKDLLLEKQEELEDYKSRCEKAVDKLTIKQARFINEKGYVLDDNDLDEIMYILQNGSENND